MASVFYNSAEQICDQGGCGIDTLVIFERIGHGFSRAAERYRLIFDPRPEWYPPKFKPACPLWWHLPGDDARATDARVWALLLADQMHRTGDL